MSFEIKNVHIENSGTGIKLEGNLNVAMKNLSFKNNNKDADFYVDSESNISIDEMISTGCETTSITYKEYSSTISDIKDFVQSKSDYFSSDEISQIKELLNEMNTLKDEPSKIKSVLGEIYDVTKSTGSGLLLIYIKLKMGWLD